MSDKSDLLDRLRLHAEEFALTPNVFRDALDELKRCAAENERLRAALSATAWYINARANHPQIAGGAWRDMVALVDPIVVVKQGMEIWVQENGGIDE